MNDKKRKAEIEQLANNILIKAEAFSLPVNLNSVCDKNNIEANYVPLTAISGFAAIRPKETKKIFINSTEPVPRQRFTAAHELGHVFLHSDQGLLVDTAETIYHFRAPNHGGGDQTQELEANYFAACLLMPATLVSTVLSTLKSSELNDEATLQRLADTFEVSKIALTTRLSALGYI
jgi:Zn-dependent peptidase ImmA (M78 family)